MSFYQNEVTEKIDSATKGLELLVRSNFADDPKANLIISHGLAEFSERYDKTASYFTARGYNVFRYDQLGHGDSDGDRGYLASPADLSDNLEVIVNLVKERFPNLSLFVLGHSMGGETVLLHATKFPNEVDGYVATDPVSTYSHPTMGDLPFEGDGKDKIPNSLGAGLVSDPRVLKKYQEHKKTLHQLTIGIFNNGLWEGALSLRKNLDKIVDPILLLQGLEDGLVSYQDTLEAYPLISSKDKELHVYPFLQHEILNEPSRNQEILAEIDSWISKHIY